MKHYTETVNSERDLLPPSNVFTLLVCPSVCLFVCLTVNRITENVMDRF